MNFFFIHLCNLFWTDQSSCTNIWQKSFRGHNVLRTSLVFISINNVPFFQCWIFYSIHTSSCAILRHNTQNQALVRHADTQAFIYINIYIYIWAVLFSSLNPTIAQNCSYYCLLFACFVLLQLVLKVLWNLSYIIHFAGGAMF